MQKIKDSSISEVEKVLQKYVEANKGNDFEDLVNQMANDVRVAWFKDCREERRANAQFLKSRIERILDEEIATYNS